MPEIERDLAELVICCGVLSTVDMGPRCVRQRKNQTGGLADLTRILERMLGVRDAAWG